MSAEHNTIYFSPTETTAQKLNAIPDGDYFFHPPTTRDGTVLLNCPPQVAEEARRERIAAMRVTVDQVGLRLALQSQDCPPVPFDLGTYVTYGVEPRRAFEHPTLSIITERTPDGGWTIPEQSGLQDPSVVRDCLDVLAKRMKVPRSSNNVAA